MEKKSPKSRIGFILFAFAGILLVLSIFIHCFGSKTALNISLSTLFGFAHFYAFPILFGMAGACFFLVIIAIVAWRFARGHKPSRWTVCLCAALLIAFTAFALFGGNAKRPAAAGHSGRACRFVAWNALDQFDRHSAKAIFLDFDADIAVLPEFGAYVKGEDVRQRVEDIFAEADIKADAYDVFTSRLFAGRIAPVTIIVKRDFATYEPMEEDGVMTVFGTLYLHSATEGIPDIIGLHTSPPIPGIWTSMSLWKGDINLIADMASVHKSAIIAGDFNATMRHGPLNTITTHYDALETLSPFQRGTWPAKLPAVFRSSIDHILLPDACSVKSVETRKMDSSDHAAIFSELIINAE